MATLLGLILSLFIADAFSFSTTSMFSIPEGKDFKMTDMFAQFANKREIKALEDRLVIINIGRAEREQIAEGLSLLSLCGPKAVGVDINFEESREDDSLLLEAIQSLPNIVLPLGVSGTMDDSKYQITDKPFFYKNLPNINYGVINLPTSSNNGRVREYTFNFPTEEGIKPSFVAALAKFAVPEKLSKLENKDKKRGLIEFQSKEFIKINLEEIENKVDSFADKIVLVGSLDDASDLHITPLQAGVPGLIIHACALSTIMDGEWYTEIPRVYDYIVAFCLCMIFMLYSYGFSHSLKSLIVRICQGLLAFFAVWLGYNLFVDYKIVFDLTFSIMIIAFGSLASDIWSGLETLWEIISKKIEKFDVKMNSKYQLR